MKTQLLKWGAVVIVLFGAVLFAANASPYTAKAATLKEAPPPAGTCELTWKDGGGGDVTLGLLYVTDQSLKDTLQGYNLLCNGINTSMCTLIPTSFGATNGTRLDLANIEKSSPWIYQKMNGQYNLGCGTNSGNGDNSGQNGNSGSGSTISLGTPSGNIHRIYECPYTDSFTGMVEPDDYFDVTTDNGGHVDCFADAGTLPVTVYNVSKVCTGNNIGYIIGTFDNGATFVKKDFPSKNQCYDISVIPVVKQITIN
jgi:hypothetical protein